MTHCRARVLRRCLSLSVAALVTALSAACGSARADRELVQRSWSGYRARFVTADGRVVRPEHDGDSVSEAQAYTLLRAVWMNDQPTFDRVWDWSRRHLARTGRDAASLWAWHWVEQEGGRVADWNAATDADTDAALALIMASERWPAPTVTGLPAYATAARATLGDLMAHAVVTDDEGTALMLPGAWADDRATGQGVVLNPSYLSPAAYRAFAAFSGDGRWTRLADDSYVVLEAFCPEDQAPVPTPDWIRWHGKSRWEPEGADATSSWDAIRIPWRVATDFLWFRTPRAQRFLTRCVDPVIDQARRTGRGLTVERSLDGRPTGAEDHPLANAMYAFGASSRADRDRLLGLVRDRVTDSEGGLFFGETDRYYVNSLAYLPFLVRSGGYSRPRAR